MESIKCDEQSIESMVFVYRKQPISQWLGKWQIRANPLAGGLSGARKLICRRRWFHLRPK
jgi:hypothetical protein